MSRKESRISVSKLEATLNPLYTSVILDGTEDVEIKIRYSLPLNDVLQFIQNVVGSVINETDYIPEILWFSIYTEVLTKYANFTLPKSIERQYDLIYNTTAVQQVMQHINKRQYDEIIEAIFEKINHAKSVMQNVLTSKMTELTNRISSFVEQSEAVFGNLTGDDVSSLAHNLATMGARGNIDEEALVRAVFNAQKEDAQAAESESEAIVPLPTK